MKTLSILLLAQLCCAAGFASADANSDIKSAGRATPSVPATPSIPPVPPRPPMPPIPPAFPPVPQVPQETHVSRAEEPPMPAMPALPAMPAMLPAPPSLAELPAPPAPPKLPVVPAEAHRACDGKSVGTHLSYAVREGATMQGICEKKGGKMVFSMQSYQVQN